MNTAQLANTGKSKHPSKIFLQDNLNMDKGGETETPLDKRFNARIKGKDLCVLFDMPGISVQIFTDDITFTGHIDSSIAAIFEVEQKTKVIHSLCHNTTLYFQ